MDDASTAAGGYTDNGDGTVTDTSTGLMWQQAGSSNSMTWEQALAYCEGLNLGGYTDWRLPTIKELYSLVDYTRYDPAINSVYFPRPALAAKGEGRRTPPSLLPALAQRSSTLAKGNARTT